LISDEDEIIRNLNCYCCFLRIFSTRLLKLQLKTRSLCIKIC